VAPAMHSLSVVYGWMCVGLSITGAPMWHAASSTALDKAVVANPGLFWPDARAGRDRLRWPGRTS
jgi:hypothetical protein